MNYSFSDAMREALRQAREEALQRGHSWVGVEHMLLALLTMSGTAARTALDNLGIDAVSLRAEILRACGTGDSKWPDGMIPYSESGRQTLEAAMVEAGELDRRDVDTGLFLLGLLQVMDGRIAELVWSTGLSVGDLRRELELLGIGLG